MFECGLHLLPVIKQVKVCNPVISLGKTQKYEWLLRSSPLPMQEEGKFYCRTVKYHSLPLHIRGGNLEQVQSPAPVVRGTGTGG